MKLLARAVRGIEWLLAAEIRAHGGVVTSTGHRCVEFSVVGAPSERLLRLGCADDVFLFVAALAGIDHRRASLATLDTAAAQLPLQQSLAALQSLRAAPLGRRFTVVASFLGARNYNRYAVEDAVASGIARATGLVYESSREGSPERPVLTWRVHLVDDQASFSLRVFEAPLHRRGYKQRSYPGTLHPPLARAMALLAGLEAGASVLDPFCGVGTLLIEALALEPSARCYGADLDPQRVDAARENAALAQLSPELTVADAAQLPFPSGSFTRVLSNVPWGVAVEPDGRLEAEPAAFWHEVARLLAPSGRALILTDATTRFSSAARGADLRLVFRSRISLFGQHPELWLLERRDAGVTASSAIVSSARYARELSDCLALAEQLPLDFPAPR